MTTPLAEHLQDVLGNRYRLERELGGGGMSRVFVATEVALGRRVVVKILSTELSSESTAARFSREIELTVRLQHPHILPILASGAFAEGLYYITPFIAGESLRGRLDREKRLPFADILRILRDTSGALAFAHGRGIVHRDVKPGNILLAEGHAILADFGIARAVSTTATPLTASGVRVGTPAYMAPELMADDKADVYSMGVVAHEMLTGARPARGANVKSILAARGRVDGDSRAQLRALAELIAEAIAPSEKRLPSAEAFETRLEAAARGRPSAAAIVAVMTTAVAATLVTGAFVVRDRAESLNGDRYLVLAVGAPDAIRTDAVGRVTAALEAWRDLAIVDAPAPAAQVNTARDGAQMAKKVNARNVITVDARQEAESVSVRADLYDVAIGSVVRTRQARLSARAPGTERTMVWRRLVNGLLRDDAELPPERAAALLGAWRAYDTGRAALRRWNLSDAQDAFRRALSLDPTLVTANLWLAQSLTWNETAHSDEERRAASLRAVAGVASLSRHDSLIAVAVLAMADSQFVRACTAYGALSRTDSADVTAWLGLGECNRRDRVVVRNAAAETGWAFRGSHEMAVRAYRRAGDVSAPAADSLFRGWLIGRLSRTLYARSEKRRLGFAVVEDTLQFVAAPRLDHDTLSFAPHRLQDPAGPRTEATVERELAAVRHSRDVLRQAAEQWVARSPNSAAALDSLAGFTEVSDQSATIGGRFLTALEVLRRARGLSRDSSQQLRLAVSETRLLVKAGDFAGARRLADSILRRVETPVVNAIPGLAALTGQRHRAARLARGTATRFRTNTAGGLFLAPPVPLAELSLSLMTYAALGGPADSITSIADRLYQLVPSYVSGDARIADVRGGLTVPALTLAYPTSARMLAKFDGYRDEYLRAELALARGDEASARQALAILRSRSVGLLPGTIAMDQTLREATLLLALGDTARATSQIDAVLLALPTLGTFLLDQVEQAGALVRTMALRAELAVRAKDSATAKRWAGAVATLWSDADADIQSLVNRMRDIVRS